MSRLHTLLRTLRAHLRLAGALALALGVLAGAVMPQQRAAGEAQAWQLPAVRAF